MVKTRRPKSDKPLASLAVKVSGDVKNIVVEMSEKSDRSVSYIVDGLLATHPEILPKLRKIRQPEQVAA